MAKNRSSSPIATAQEVGGAAEQTDRVRAETVWTAGGERVQLAVVADGEGHYGGSAAAAWIVAQVFQIVEQSRSSEFAQVLRRALETSHEGLLARTATGPARVTVSATAVAVHKGRAYAASCGNGEALRISSGKASLLTRRTEGRLGAEPGPGILTGPRQGFSLDRGDRVVLASDGIFRINPATREPYVSSGEIAQLATELSSSEAARHLISLALGRDVDDSVSVVVLALPGAGRSARRSMVSRLVLPAALLAAASIGALVWAWRSQPVATSDFGFAVLVSGGAAAESAGGEPQPVSTLGTIPSGSVVTALTDARLALQSTFEGESDLTAGTLYLGQDAVLELISLDSRSASDASDRPGGVGLTELQLHEGTLLVLRANGNREYRLRIRNVEVSLGGAGQGALGIEASHGQVVVACLVGACRVVGSDGEGRLLQAGQTDAASEGVWAEPVPIQIEARFAWNDLCQGCLTGR